MSQRTPIDPPVPERPRRRGLGRGLDALFSGPALAPPASAATGTEADEGTLVEIPVEAIRPNPEQPRQHFDETALAELAESIRTHGLLQPVVVERAGDAYRLVAGERRLRAVRLAGLSRITALVRPATESGRHALELALVENLHRTDLGALEEAAAYARLADTFGLSHEAIGLRVGRSRSAVSNTVRLLSLAAGVQEALAAGRLTAGHARALLALPDHAEQEAAAGRVDAEGLTVRQTERLVQERLGAPAGVASPPPSGRTAPERPPAATPDDAALERALEDTLGSPVRLQRRRRGGTLTITFFSDEELDALYRLLGGPQL